MHFRAATGVWMCLLVACKRGDAPSQQAPSAPPAAAAPDNDNSAQEKFPPTEAAKPASGKETEATAAADVVRRYYAALAARDYKAAYVLWSGRGEASKQTFDAFQAGFASTRSTSVDVEQAGEVEGAAGSLYISIPVSVHAELNDGVKQEFSGSYVLRRVNDVEGSSQEQRSWRIYSASLRPAK